MGVAEKARRMNRHLRMLARIGRTTTYTRKQLEEKLARYGTPSEVKEALDEAFAIPEEDFKARMYALADSIVAAEGVMKPLDGKNTDARGMDDADRVMQSIVNGALDLDDPKGRA